MWMNAAPLSGIIQPQEPQDDWAVAAYVEYKARTSCRSCYADITYGLRASHNKLPLGFQLRLSWNFAAEGSGTMHEWRLSRDISAG